MAWSSFARALVVTAMAVRDRSGRDPLCGVAALAAMGVVLLALAPARARVAAASEAD
jgi:hypothetical protein